MTTKMTLGAHKLRYYAQLSYVFPDSKFENSLCISINAMLNSTRQCYKENIALISMKLIVNIIKSEQQIHSLEYLLKHI